jgi:hypothetical protein
MTVQLLSVSTFLYRALRAVWRDLVPRCITNSAPTTRSGEQTHPETSAASHNPQAERLDNPPDAVYPQCSGDFAATPDQRSSMARYDTAAAVESETAMHNAHVCVWVRNEGEETHIYDSDNATVLRLQCRGAM